MKIVMRDGRVFQGTALQIVKAMQDIAFGVGAKVGTSFVMHAHGDETIDTVNELVSGDGTLQDVTGTLQDVEYNNGALVNVVHDGKAYFVSMDQFKAIARGESVELDGGISVSAKAKLSRTSDGFIAFVDIDQDDGKLKLWTYDANYQLVGQPVIQRDDVAYATMSIGDDGRTLGKMTFIYKPTQLEDGSAQMASNTDVDWGKVAANEAADNPAFAPMSANG